MNTQTTVNLENFPMIEACVINIQQYTDLTTDQVIEAMRMSWCRSASNCASAKKNGMIVNQYAEDFAMQWMSFYNQYCGKNHY